MLGPEVLAADVFRKSFTGLLDVGLGEGFLYAEFQVVPEQLGCAWRRLLDCAEIVVGCLFRFEQVEEFAQWCVQEYVLCSCPFGHIWVAPESVFGEGVEFVLLSSFYDGRVVGSRSGGWSGRGGWKYGGLEE